ncbi:MAG: glycosyltransferase family 4 protein [Sedimentisphaerales bacterium]|nr:glycosyltransferase family 4 protein [Sedimentisphaerales bacterium]
MRIRTLMLGWEFPPYISGGLGTACFGLTKAMDRLGMPVTFVLPRAKPIRLVAGTGEPVGSESADDPLHYAFRHVRLRPVGAALTPYASAGMVGVASRHASGLDRFGLDLEADSHAIYGPDMVAEVHRYAEKVLQIAETEEFDIIHAHDWMTYPAGVALAAHSGKPLVIHVHSTEFDRSGEHVNQYVYDIERHAMHVANRIIAVSNYTRNIIISRYGVSPEKVEVVYNGVDGHGAYNGGGRQAWPAKTDKVVLFLGRITMQKGPEYFLYAAKKVLEKMNNVKFIMAGDGDLLYGSIELAAHLGIGHQVFFTRFLRGDDVHKAYQMADLYVMPSVSEPFGIAPLEALQHDVPVLVSKQSGIAEAFRNALKVDFWDINEMANKMIAVLRHPPLHEMLRVEGRKEAFRFRWEDSAARVNEIYHATLGVA